MGKHGILFLTFANYTLFSYDLLRWWGGDAILKLMTLLQIVYQSVLKLLILSRSYSPDTTLSTIYLINEIFHVREHAYDYLYLK